MNDDIIEELQKALNRAHAVIEQNLESKVKLEKAIIDDLKQTHKKVIDEMNHKLDEKKQFIRSFREKWRIENGMAEKKKY